MLKGFSLKLTTLALILGFISLALYLWVPAIPVSPAFPYALIFLYLFTLIVYSTLSKSMQKRTSQFANAVMLVNFGKLLIYAALIFIYAYFRRSDAIPFTLIFFVYYIFFTSMEVFSLLNAGKK